MRIFRGGLNVKVSMAAAGNQCARIRPVRRGGFQREGGGLSLDGIGRIKKAGEDGRLYL
jgi:hypothetical protein